VPHATIHGAKLWYEVRGEGEPLLLHHGYTASRVNWLSVAERLQDRYRVILMECRGTGESEHTRAGYTLEQYAADVVGLADHLEIDRLTFAGHSMGGGIGYRLALDHAARLERLILMAAIPARGTGSGDPAAAEARNRIRKAGDRATLIAGYQATRFRPDVETDAWFESRVDHVLGVSDGHYEAGGSAMRDLAVEERLGEIEIPTLVIAGGADGLLRANLRDYMKLPNAVLQVFARAGHEVAVHEPAGVAEAIDGFMQHGVVNARTLAAQAARAGGSKAQSG